MARVSVFRELKKGSPASSFQRCSYSVFLPRERRVDSRKESAQFRNIPFRNKLDPPLIFHHLNFLSGLKMQVVADEPGNHDLKLG